MRTFRLAISVAAASALIPLTASAAFAAPPANDTPDGAIALSLGQTVKQDTTKATTGPIDAEANKACGAPHTNASVWYSYSPSADGGFILDMSKSNYSGGFLVFKGAPSANTLIDCGPTQLGIKGTAGRTYTIMVISDTKVNGGNLVLSLQKAPPPPRLTVTVDPRGTAFKDGSAQVSGTYSCKNADFLFMEGELTQTVGRFNITGYFYKEVTKCDGVVHPWSVVVRSDTGQYSGGKAATVVFHFGCGAFECSRGHVKQTIQLTRG